MNMQLDRCREMLGASSLYALCFLITAGCTDTSTSTRSVSEAETAGQPHNTERLDTGSGEQQPSENKSFESASSTRYTVGYRGRDSADPQTRTNEPPAADNESSASVTETKTASNQTSSTDQPDTEVDTSESQRVTAAEREPDNETGQASTQPTNETKTSSTETTDQNTSTQAAVPPSRAAREVTIEDVERELKQAKAALDGFMAQKEKLDFQNKMERQLRDFDKTIDSLESEVEQAQQRLSQQEKHLDNVRAKKEALVAELEQLDPTTADDWAAKRDRINAAWQALQDARQSQSSNNNSE